MKTCSKCGQEQPIEAFHRNPTPKNPDNRRSTCKTCDDLQRRMPHRKAQVRARYWANKAQENAKSSAYRAAHREELNARKRQYHAEHKRRLNAYSRQYHAENRARLNQHDRDRQHQRRLAKHNITAEQFVALLREQHCLCVICERPIDWQTRYAIDHDHKCCRRKPGKTGSCGKCIRGLLCFTCNKNLGAWRDDIDTLRRAIAYIQNPPAKRALRKK